MSVVQQAGSADAGVDARGLVARLVGDELASLAGDVRDNRTEHALRSLDQRGMAQQLIREQYSGRYPFELLQNANDAAAARLRKGDSQGLRVRFIVGSQALLVADQGIGFGVDEVRAICGLGRSSKDPRKSVGYKGLGFKSVGEICDKPQIITPDLMFGFDPDRVFIEVGEVVGNLLPEGQRLPTYAFPFLLDHSDLGDDAEVIDTLLEDGFRTVLRLPYRSEVSVEKVADDVATTIRPQLLLFLPATGRLEVVGTDHDFEAASDREPAEDHDVVLLEVDGLQEFWHVFSRPLTPPSTEMMKALGDAWVEVETVQVGAAIRLDEERRPDASVLFPLNVYFPTEEKPGLPLLLQADFALDLDRRFVKRSPEAHDYNTWLADQLGRLVGEVVAPSLARSFPDEGRVIDVVSPRSGQDGFGGEVTERVVEHLRTSRFIPCIDSRVRLPGEALLLPDSITNAFAALRLMDTSDHGHLVLAYAQKRPHTRRLLEESLEVEALEEEETLPLLSPTDPDILDRLYDLLVRWDSNLGRRLTKLTRELPLVLTRSGSWHTPADGLFFPRSRQDPEIFDELPVEVVVVPDVEGGRELLERMGVKSFRWRDVLEERVLPVLTDSDSAPEETEAAWKLLRAYFGQPRSGDQDIVGRLHNVLLPAASASGTNPVTTGAGELYLSADWLGHDRLARIYGPFTRSEFLALAPPDDEEERAAEIEFLRWLGVADRPRVFSARTDQKDVYRWDQSYRHPHSRLDKQLWANWTSDPEVVAASACSQNHSASQQLRSSHHLDRISELAGSGNPDRLAALFVELRSKWPYYSSFLSSTFYCQHSAHNGPDRQRQVPSLLGFALTRLSWVPAAEDDQVVLVPPAQAWRLSPETPRRVAGVVPALRPDLDAPQAAAICIDLGVVDAARADSADLIQLLRRLAGRHQASESPDNDLFETARWAVGHLNDALDRDAQLPEGLLGAPLPVIQDGESIFTTDPYFCDDADLRQAWPDLAILDAGRELRRLRTALNLEDLANVVETRARPVGIDDESSERLTSELRLAAPYLAAAALEASPSRSDTILARLPRIEVVACDELGLSYTMGEVERTRDAATSFLEGRTVGSGQQRRTLGTAYLELDRKTRRPAWYAFGPQLAEFVDVPAQRDAFALILNADGQARRRYLESRGISEEAVAEARQELAKRSEESDFEEAFSTFSPWDETTVDSDDEDALSDEGPGYEKQWEPDSDGDSSDAAGSGGSSGDVESEDLVLPPADVEGLVLEQAPHALIPADIEPRRRGGVGGSSRAPIDWDRVGRVTRKVGRWGEELVYNLERQRVESFGHDPKGVIWRSRKNELSPYDIRSLDADGRPFYIEVKTTTQIDIHTPFDISVAELAEAFFRRDRYHVYRILGAGTDRYRVVDFDDPAGRLLNQEGVFRFTSGRLYLAAQRDES